MDVMSRGNYTYSFGNTKITGSAVSNYVNTAIKWEKKKTIDFGLDLGNVRQSIGVYFRLYKSTSEDLLYSVAVPTNAGVTNGTVTMNAATMENSGLEFLLAYHNHKHAVKFDISSNLSTITNKVTKLAFQANLVPLASAAQRSVVKLVHSMATFMKVSSSRRQRLITGVNSEGIHINQSGAQPGDVAYARP